MSKLKQDILAALKAEVDRRHAKASPLTPGDREYIADLGEFIRVIETGKPENVMILIYDRSVPDADPRHTLTPMGDDA